MLLIRGNVAIPDEEIDIQAVRAQGPGGQNVNKVATAIHLRFDVGASSLPDAVKQRLLRKKDRRITAEGLVVIKAGNHRSQERNREDARARLAELVASALDTRRKRIPTRPGKAAKERRLDAKKRRGRLKKLRDTPLE